MTIRSGAGASMFARLRQVPVAVVLIVLAVFVFGGSALLGHASDSYTDFELYRSTPLGAIALNPAYNRYPVWGLLVYPLLLAAPLWLAHLALVGLHTANALLLLALVTRLTDDRRIGLIAALLFLTAPMVYEAVLWLSGGMFVCGVGCALGGGLLLLRRRAWPGIALLSAAALCSEALLLPTLLLALVIAVQLRLPRWRALASLAAICLTFLALQGLRLTVTAREFTPYAVGTSRLAVNAQDAATLALGVGSPVDATWRWDRVTDRRSAVLLLPSRLLLPSGVLAALSALVVLFGPLGSRPQPTRRLLLALGIGALGFWAAVAVPLLLTGNWMQNRYVYPALPFMTSLAALLLARVFASRAAPLGVTALVGLLTIGIYGSWSLIWVNWYPARLVSERVLADLRVAVQRGDIRRVYIVGDPKAVGVGMTIADDWGYASAARMGISPGLVVGADELVTLLRDKQLMRPGARFTNEPCVFMAWRRGRMIVTTRLHNLAADVVLRCDKGTVVALRPGERALKFNPWFRRGREDLAEVLGFEPTPDNLLAQLVLPSLR